MVTAPVHFPDPSSSDKHRCYVDGVKNVSEQHHIIPVEYNGPRAGKTVPLCPTCHTNIHREAEEQAKTGKKGLFCNHVNYPDDEDLERALLLAEYVKQAKLRFIADGAVKGNDTRNMMQVSFKPNELAIAHDVKRRMGFRSMERMVKTLIFDKWQDLQKR